jgi:hypothetical protein
MTDGGASDAGTDVELDASDTGAEASEHATDAAVRTLTTRPLLPTPVNNLLLDPFITADRSWGHFRAVVPALDPAETGADCPVLTREILSASPIGVSAPGILVNQTVLPPSLGCTAIIAPFVGSTEAVAAQIWVSLSDATGAPLAFPSGSDGGGALDGILTVSLLSTALPSDAGAPMSYPFTIASTPPVVLAGRSWGLLELDGVSIPEGGWFVVTLTSPTRSLYMAAPQVVPGATGHGRRPGPARSRPVTEIERGATLQYGRVLPFHPPVRWGRPERVERF